MAVINMHALHCFFVINEMIQTLFSLSACSTRILHDAHQPFPGEARRRGKVSWLVFGHLCVCVLANYSAHLCE